MNEKYITYDSYSDVGLHHGTKEDFLRLWNSTYIYSRLPVQSWYLAVYCARFFDIWWDSDKYNWVVHSHVLVQHCCSTLKNGGTQINFVGKKKLLFIWKNIALSIRMFG